MIVYYLVFNSCSEKGGKIPDQKEASKNKNLIVTWKVKTIRKRSPDLETR